MNAIDSATNTQLQDVWRQFDADPALRLAEMIAARGPLAVRAAKRAILEGLDTGLDNGLRLEEHLFRELMLTEDAVEGPRAFAEKRPPDFRGGRPHLRPLQPGPPRMGASASTIPGRARRR
jgi:enoyl-CoA hydratase/carnithine racemase